MGFGEPVFATQLHAASPAHLALPVSRFLVKALARHRMPATANGCGAPGRAGPGRAVDP